MSFIQLEEIKDKNNNDEHRQISLNTSKSFISDVNTNNNDYKNKLLYLIDIFLSGFLFTPIVILNWASTWDIAYVYIFNDSTQFYLSILTTLLSSHIIILLFYIFQFDLQHFHNEMMKNKSVDFYYGRDYLFRCFFTYILTTAYVFKWRSYWDLISHFTSNIHWYYFFALTLLTLICFRFVLKRSFESLARTVPFYLLTDKHFLDHYFLQPKVMNVENRAIDVLGDFFFNEIVDSIISTYVWKGFWDMLSYLAQLSFQTFNFNQNISILIVCLIGYFIYFFILLFQHTSSKFFLSKNFSFNQETTTIWNENHNNFLLKLKIISIEIIYFMAFFSIICIWFSLWTLYDKYTLGLQSDRKFFTIFLSHIFSVIFLASFKCVNTLYGPATLDMDPADINYHLIEPSETTDYVRRYNNDMYHVQYSDSSLFRISYFSKS